MSAIAASPILVRTRTIRWSFILMVLASAGALFLLWALFLRGGSPIAIGFDGHAYWGYPRAQLYEPPGPAGAFNAYRYSPAFVPLMTLWSAIPYQVWLSLWTIGLVAIYVWMTGPYWLPLLLFLPFLQELAMGNIHMLLALAVVLGFRWPAAWAFVLLSKVTPGVGLVWFAVRREWRSLGIALGATAAIAAVSLVLAPGQWAEWIRSLSWTTTPDNGTAILIPLPARLVAGALLVAWGARTDRRWTVMVAATICLPILWYQGAAMLVGLVALHRGLPENAEHSLDWLTGLVQKLIESVGEDEAWEPVAPGSVAGHRWP